MPAAKPSPLKTAAVKPSGGKASNRDAPSSQRGKKKSVTKVKAKGKKSDLDGVSEDVAMEDIEDTGVNAPVPVAAVDAQGPLESQMRQLDVAEEAPDAAVEETAAPVAEVPLVEEAIMG